MSERHFWNVSSLTFGKKNHEKWKFTGVSLTDYFNSSRIMWKIKILMYMNNWQVEAIIFMDIRS